MLSRSSSRRRLPAWRFVSLPALSTTLATCLLLVAGPAGATALPSGPVAPGSTLQFSLTLADFTILVDRRADYPQFGCTTPNYIFNAIWPDAVSPPPRPHVEIPGTLTTPNGSFDFTVPVSASLTPGFVFFVDATVIAPCGSASFFSANAHFGPYTVAAPPPPPPPPAARCRVPDVRGKTVAQARTLLSARRCALGRTTQAFSTKVRKGRIVGQSRRPGTLLAAGARVNVVVSRGPRR
jgi:hypothetical protein